MRISVREDDTGYNPEACTSYGVLLDGVEIADCFTADEELGIAYCYKRGPDGKFITKKGYTKISNEFGGSLELDTHELEEEERYGKVEIRKPEEQLWQTPII